MESEIFFQIVSVHFNLFILIDLIFQRTIQKKITSNKIKQVLKKMVRTRRQQASFDEVEEEAEIYHRTDMEDTRIMMENGLEAEGIDHMMGRTNDEDEDFERQLQDLRKACVSEKSQNNYLISVTNMINWFATNMNESQNDGFIPLMQSWREQLLTFENDSTRKIWIRSKLDDANPADPPIDFNLFQAGKFIVYYIKLYHTIYY